MKILYFYQYFCTPKGGYSTRAYEFARRWVKAGDQVTIVTTVYDKSDLRADRFLSRLRIEGIDLRVVNIRVSNRKGIASRLPAFIGFALIACYYALVLPADVVLASSGPLSTGLPGLIARYLRRKPFLFEVRDLWPENAIQIGLLRNRLAIAALRWFERACYRASRTVVALSEGMGEWIEQRYAIADVRVITNASDIEMAERIPPKPDLPEWAQGRPLVVYAGAMGFTYDSPQLLRIAGHLAELGAGDVQLVVLGSGSDLALVKDQAVRLGLRNIHFLGLVSKEEVFAWLKRARCALSIVRQAAFFDACSPNKLYDAFAVGIPIVQDTQGWIKRLLEREHCGITVSRGDSKAMAEAIAALVRDEGLHASMSESARRLGREEFDRGLLADRMLSILHGSAARPSDPQPAGMPARKHECLPHARLVGRTWFASRFSNRLSLGKMSKP